LVAQGAAGPEPKRVLVVQSFGSTAPPFTTHSTAFEATLTEEMGKQVDLDEVSLDMARYAQPDMEEAFVNFLHHRLTKWQPDLVVPIGSPAALFVARNRAQLFPRTPILYAGLDRRLLPNDALQTNASYVGQVFDISGVAEDIFQLAPQTANIVVVVGASPLEQHWAEVFRRAFDPYTNRASCTLLNDLPFDKMLERVAKLPPCSFIFMGLLVQDVTGVTINEDEALQRLHAVANAPINGLFENQLGLGIVGGRLYRAETIGAESARVAIRILQGENASSIAPEVMPPSGPQYDWRELNRWKISEARLPAGSIIKFRQSTVWERYRWWITGVFLITVAEALLIVGLTVNLVKRRRAQDSLRESEERLALATDSARAGLWSMRLDTGRVWVTRPIRDLFEFALDEELTFDSFLGKTHPEDREQLHQAVQRSLQDGQNLRIEYRVVLSDGNYRWIVSRGGPHFNASGKPDRLMGVSIDITERKKSEEVLAEAQARIVAVVESTEDLIWSVDPKRFGLVTFNRALRDYFFTSYDLLIHEGMTPDDLLPTQYALEWRELYLRALREGPFVTEYRTSSNTKTLLLSLNLLRRNGEVFGISVFGKDITERKRTEAALQESEERLTLATDSASVGLWRIEIDTQRVWFSPKMREMLRFGPNQEVTYEAVLQAIHLADHEPLTCAVQQALEQRKEIAIEFRIVRPEGGIWWLSNRGRPHYDASGRPESITGVSVDVTERKRAEEALAESEDRFRQVAENVGDFIWEVDANGLYTYASPSVERILGYTPDELVGKKHFYDLFDPAVREEMKAAGLLAFAARKPFRDFPNPNVSRSGTIVHLETSGVPILDPTGNLTGYRGADTDITERKREEEFLRQSEERLRLVLEANSEGVWDWNIPSGKAFFSRPYSAMLGYEPEEFPRDYDGWKALVHPDDFERVHAAHAAHIHQGKEFCVEFRMRKKSGDWCWIRARGTVVERDAEGRAIRMVGTHEDITERRQNEDEMRRLRLQAWHADRVARTGAITSSLAHELNQPLAAVLSNAQAALRFLARENPDLNEIREILGDIVHADKRAGAVISGLRSMLRRAETHREKISLAEAIRETMDLLHGELLGRQVEAKRHCESDCFVLADKAQIQQVILNLIMNSIEAMQEQPVHRRRLEVALTHPKADTAQIAVRDSGPGVPDEQIAKLFEAFWTTKSQGMGIGLPICRSIVESHGGRIWHANNGNGGATFYFTLPVETVVPLGKQRSRREPISGVTKTDGKG
jgi:PAS domain S-box-containing protein